MATVNPTRATAADLMRTEGKAELIGGKVVQFMATGMRPSEVASNIHINLRAHARKHGHKAFGDNLGYIVPELLSGRESFSPDTSYYDGPLPQNRMGFIEGPPTFAVEVRSESDYKPSALVEMAAKRADYFAAGTKVVWDVDPLAETIDCYRASDPDHPIRFTKDQEADAEPAVPGWRIAGADVFA
jgi:Uma2 family endonuclease